MKKSAFMILFMLLANQIYSQNTDLMFFQKVMYDLFYHKPLRQQIKKSFKNSENPNLSDFMNKVEFDEKNSAKIIALEQTPYSMYLFLGFWYGCYKKTRKRKLLIFQLLMNIITTILFPHQTYIYLKK